MCLHNHTDNFLQSKPPWGPIPKAPIGHTWESLMQLALNEAQKGVNMGEIPVGSLVVNEHGEILGLAHNQCIKKNDPTAHAEILALRQAGKKINNYRLLDCYLIVTLEPCLMCAGAINQARLKGVIFGAYDLRAGAICSCLEGLNFSDLKISIWHLGGILSEECKKILQNFFINKRNQD